MSMGLELFSIIVLVVMFVVCTILPINLGLMSFVTAFAIGTLLAGLTVDDIFAVFPGDLFILLVGVTLLFAIAQNNGTVDWIMAWGLRLVRGNIGLIPWIMFLLTALMCGVGSLSAAGVAVVAPVALRFAAQYSISPLLMGVMVVQGATAGSYSPLSPFGATTNGLLASEGLPQSPGLLFANSMVFNALFAVIPFVLFGGIGLLGRQVEEPAAATPAAVPAGTSTALASGPVPPPAASDSSDPGTEDGGRALDVHQIATMVGIGLLILSAFLFSSSDRFDVGFAAMVISLVLLLMSPGQQAEAFRRMPWGVIVLITGILTYIGVMDEVGAIDYVQDALASVSNPLLSTLAASYVGGIISAFASTAGILGVAIPLAAPILENTALPAIGVVTSIAIASAIVDVSPFSTNGALLLANAQNVDARKFFRQLLTWAVFVIAFAPLLTWLVFVVIGIP
jgi:Na+/H+ antiporter NhaD/arsenite permease-like protein